MNTSLFTSCSTWIWLPDAPETNCYTQFRQSFRMADTQIGVNLHISVEGQYAAFLNGRHIPSGQYSDFPHFKAVQTPDITQLLQPGENTLEIRVWYPGVDTSVSRRETPGLRFEVRQGIDILCCSDCSCAARLLPGYVQGPVEYITPQLGMSFHYEIPKPRLWKSACSIYKQANLVLRPIKEMVMEGSKPARVLMQGVFWLCGGATAGERMQNACLSFRTGSVYNVRLPAPSGLHLATEAGDGIFLILDLGAETSGYLTLDITTLESTKIDVGFGEHLDDLRVRTSVGGRSFGVTVWGSSERHRFIHYFRRLGCRYLQLFIHGREAVVYEASIIPVTYPVNRTPSFRCSDTMYNQIYETAKKTLHLCMHEHYEDCPWREQALYGFDSRNQMLAGYYAFGEFTYARENLRLLALSQRSDNLLELCAPARVPVNIPTFSLAFIIALEEYCRYSGDLAFGCEMLCVAENILDSFRSHVCNGIAWNYREPGYWNFYEWNDLLDGTPIEHGESLAPSADAGLQLFGLLALQRMSALHQYLGLDTEALDLECNTLIKGLEQFWNGDVGAYSSFLRDGKQIQYAELIQALTLYTGACPDHRQAKLRQGLSDGRWLPVTLSYSIFKYEALLQEPALYAEETFRQIVQRWGKMLLAGATSFWETDEGAEAFERAGSLCHGWSGIPVYLYGAYILGVQPNQPGIWRPCEKIPCGIHTVQGVLVSPEGQIKIGSTPGPRAENWFCLQKNGEKIYL